MAMNKHPSSKVKYTAPSPSDGRGVSIDKCVESLKDLYSSAAQLVQSLETRRRNKGWTLRFWSKKSLEGEAKGLYDALIGGRASIQEAFKTAQSMLIYAMKSCQANNPLCRVPKQTSNLSLLMQSREEFRENVYWPLQLALNAEKGPLAVDFGEIKRATEDSLASILSQIS
jgi:hypothetical protein